MSPQVGWGRFLSLRTWLLLGTLGLFGFAWVCTSSRTSPSPAVSVVLPARPPAVAQRSGDRLTPFSLAPPPALKTMPAMAAHVAAEELRHPHPITPAHRRIFEENNRIAALNGALDRGDVAEIRRLNADYRRVYPEDEQVLQEGYDLVADCLEQRSDRTLQAAQRFWLEQRASTLRRYVRRHCISDASP